MQKKEKLSQRLGPWLITAGLDQMSNTCTHTHIHIHKYSVYGKSEARRLCRVIYVFLKIPININGKRCADKAATMTRTRCRCQCRAQAEERHWQSEPEVLWPQPWPGPCFGPGPGQSARRRRALTSASGERRLLLLLRRVDFICEKWSWFHDCAEIVYENVNV